MKQSNGVTTKTFETLMYQLLETEIGGVEVYETALRCAVDEDLRKEWQKYLDETRKHVEIATRLVEAAGFDTERQGPGRDVVRTIGNTLVQVMEAALAEGDAEAAQLVACEAVVHAETKDHMNWELLSELAGKMKGPLADQFKEACEEVEEQEDEHLYHTKGWTRELWLKGLGLGAVIPPPEEKKDVKTAIAAERAKKSRKRMMKRPGARSNAGRRRR